MNSNREQLTQRRARLVHLLRIARGILSRAEISGLEHVPPAGPALICFNHLSILDGPMVVSSLEGEVELVGPGDFPMTPIEEVVVKAYDVTRINRGRADRASLRTLLAHLKAGRRLAMAPDGGTWEKPITAVKTGAAYLSQATGAPIIPVGLGGLYEVPTFDVGKLITRPPISIRFGEPMPPVPESANRRARHADLEAAAEELMYRIYDLLPAADQARYDHWGRAEYDLLLDFEDEGGQSIVYDGPPLPDMTALGEFVVKRNLFRPMHVNAALLLTPFREERFFAAMEVRLTARDLYRALTEGHYDAYLHYRLGSDKAYQALTALQYLEHEVTEWALANGARIRLRKLIKDRLSVA